MITYQAWQTMARSESAMARAIRSLRRRLGLGIGAVLLLTSGALWAADPYVITGDPTSTVGPTWHLLGNSLQSSPVIWADTGTSGGMNYSIYTASWYLTGTESIGAGVLGNNLASLSSGVFATGDRVVAVAWKALDANLGNSLFFKVDPNSNGGYAPGSAVYGTVGSTSFGTNSDKGDYQIYVANSNWTVQPDGSAFRVRDVTTNNFYPYNGGVALNIPVRAFVASPNANTASAGIILMDANAIAAASYVGPQSNPLTLNTFSNALKFYFQLVGTGTSTGVVLSGADITPVAISVPEPAALTLLGLLAGAGLCRRRSPLQR